MDPNDLPNQIQVTISDGCSLVFSRVSSVIEPKDGRLGSLVVYEADRFLSRADLTNVLAREGETMEGMNIAPLDPPIVSSKTACRIADFIFKRVQQTGLPELAEATSWTIVPLKREYHNDKEIILAIHVSL